MKMCECGGQVRYDEIMHLDRCSECREFSVPIRTVYDECKPPELY